MNGLCEPSQKPIAQIPSVSAAATHTYLPRPQRGLDAVRYLSSIYITHTYGALASSGAAMVFLIQPTSKNADPGCLSGKVCTIDFR